MANPKFKESISFLLTNSAGIAFERFDGTIAVADLDNGSTVKTIADANVLLDGAGVPKINTAFTPIDKLITSIEVKYQKIIPEKDQYGAVKFAKRSGATIPAGEERHNFTLSDTVGLAGTYCGLLQSAYEQLGEERPLTVYADAIRDADTAERLARAIILKRYKSLAQISFESNYSLLDLEIGDKVAINLTYLSAALNATVFMVTGYRIIPNVGADAGIRIVLTELGSANLPAAGSWVEVGAGGSTLLEVGSGGTHYQEIGV